MANGRVVSICIGSKRNEPMHSVKEATALTGKGLAGDRYALGQGSYNQGKVGNRQVTLINAKFVTRSSFSFVETRRNIAVIDFELMDHIGHTFRIGEAVFRGIKYCDPCLKPSVLSGKKESFRETFLDCGGLVAEVLHGGLIKVGSVVVPRKRDY